MPNPIVSTNLLSFLRYGALAAGVVIGFTTDRAYYLQYKAHQEHEKKHNELLAKANELWSEHITKESGISFNPDDKNFDLEKVLNYASAQQ